MSTNTEEADETQKDDNNDTAGTEKEAEINEVIPGYANFDDYMKSALGALTAGIKSANSLPNGENFSYYSCFPGFHEARSKELKKILNIMQGVVELSGVPGNAAQRDTEEKFDLLVEANDIFLDQAGICMDKEEGLEKKPGVSLVVSETSRKSGIGSWNATTLSHPPNLNDVTNNVSSIRLLAARNVHRPQLLFKDKVDNSSKPWEPRIKDKPNSLKPLAIYLEEDENGPVFNHPYEFELEKFEVPQHQLEKSHPIMYKTLDETPLIIIEKQQDLKILLQDLKEYNEIAVDLEHHSYRTFQGITCLMQISTRDTDYLVDTIALRSDLHVLNEIFTKPTILKVFHGADSDVQWLQRDLSLYVVNMFDTHQAAKQLDLPYLSLAYLMKRHCNVDPNKHFQLADWRIRPLPEELRNYAREDTHYLLYIKDVLRNELVDSANGKTNVLRAVYDRSTEVCKIVYKKPVWTEDSYMNMYRKSQKMFNNRQLFALRELHKWRNDVAREVDDSVSYVLPNHMLLNIAETLPREMQGILACCNPIPPLVRQNLLKLHKIILQAREQPLIKPILEQDIRQRLTQRNQAANSDVWINSPHDIPSGMEVRANLPCLLSSEETMDIVKEEIKVDHSVTVFDGPTGSDNEVAMERRRLLRQKKIMFISPFERYKRVMPMVAAQEEQERKEKEKEEEEKKRAALKEEEKTAMSIERVHEHFKNVVKSINIDEDPNESRKNKTPVPLGQMHGRKRKRQSDVPYSTDYQEDSNCDVSTPKPSMETTIAQSYVRKRKHETNDCPETRKEMKYEPASSSNSNIQKDYPPKAKKNFTNKVSPKKGAMRGTQGSKRKFDAFSNSQHTRRDQKRANIDELKKKGMLPQQNFDYKSVDFSSFQGGSTSGDVSRSTPFQQQKQKDKSKRSKKRKKQKISGI